MALDLYFLTFYGGWRGPKCLALGCLFHRGSHTGFFALLGTAPAFAFAAVFFLEPVSPRGSTMLHFFLIQNQTGSTKPHLFICLFVCCFEDLRSKIEYAWVQSFHSQPSFVGESLCWAKPLT